MVRARLSAALAVALAHVACGPSVPRPRPATHAGETAVLVPEAPPVPHVELLPPAPEDIPGAVWIDGQWLLRGRRWEWEPGRWEVPPEGAGYAPPVVVYLPGGKIAWFAGVWRQL